MPGIRIGNKALWALLLTFFILVSVLAILSHFRLNTPEDIIIVHGSPLLLPTTEIGIVLGLVCLALGVVTGLCTLCWLEAGKKAHEGSQRVLPNEALIEHLDGVSLFANDIILLMDEKMRIKDANNRALDVYGYTRDEILQLTIQDIRSSDAPLPLNDIIRELSEKECLLFESIHRRKDGSTFPIETSSRLIRIGEATRIQSIIRDISARKHIEKDFHNTVEDLDRKLSARVSELEAAKQQIQLGEESYRESENLYQVLFDNAGDPILIYNLDGHYLEVNQAVCKKLGYTREEFLKMGPADISSVTYARLFRERLQTIRENGFLVGDTVYVSKTGELIPMEVHARVIEFRGEPAIMSIARDIADRVRMEEVLIQARAELEHRVEERTAQLATLNDQLRKEIEERGITEMALVESEEKYRNLFQESMNGFSLNEVVLDPDGKVQDLLFLEVNPAFERIMGKPQSSIVGKGIKETFSSKDGYWFEHLTETALHGVSVHFELNGAEIGKYLEVSAFQPKFGQVAVLVSDITDRKKAEVELDQSQQMLRLVLDNTPQRVFWKDLESRFWGCNLAFAQDAGLNSPEEIVGRTDWDLSWSAEAEKYRSDDLLVIQSGIPKLSYGELQPRQAGPPRWLNTSKVPLRDQFGEVIGLLGTYEDVTERKQAESKNQQLAAIVAQAVEGFLVTDTHGVIEYVNPAYEKITGYTQNELIGQRPNLLKSGRHPIGFYRDLWDTILGGNTWTGRMVNRKKDGTHFHEEATISPILDSKGVITHFVAVKRDITREIEMEIQLRQSQKLEAIGQLAGGIAHDFNNLLQVILAYSEFVKIDLPEGSKSLDDLDRVINAASRGADLTRQMLAFSRRTDLTISSFDVRPQIKEIVKMLERTIPASISIAYSFEQDLPLVVADPSQIHQVILNLCINAKDAMPHGGRLILSASKKTITTMDCHERPGSSAGTFTVIEVSDTGTGIPEEHRQHIFEPFFTTKPPGKGTGLGLASAYGIIKQHGGFLEVESKVGIGSAFRVFLPCVQKQEEDQTSKQTTIILPRGNETILIAEDHEDILELARRGLVNLGYLVHAARNGREALEIFTKAPEKIDIVLLDMQMPEVDGETSLERIRRIRQDARVIVASGFVDTETRARLKDLGANEVLQKPYQMDKLSVAIRTILDAPKAN
jgi:two-component system, cell cycle sensor histidine kinase and response regulator CckA